MKLQPELCHQAIRARDPRFDGLFFVGVTTTGIYCRPVCPARTPGASRCRYFANAAAAEAEGFRPCLRCRPELAPGFAPMDAVGRVARAAAARIEAGALNQGSLDALAAEFELSGRQLRRVMEKELGVMPIQLAQTQRLLMAKRLLTETRLSMVEVAHASGFASLRRFNALFRSRYTLSPGALRRGAGGSVEGDRLQLRLAYRPPLAWTAFSRFLAGRSAEAVERVEGQCYWRTVRLADKRGWISVEPAPDGHWLRLQLSASLVSQLPALLSRLRQMFDLSAQPALIDAHLAQDPRLRLLVQRTPGLRVPGAFDGFELAVRSILGQRISVRVATILAGKVAETFGEAIDTPLPGLRRLFPDAETLAQVSAERLRAIGLGGPPVGAIRAVARAVADGRLRLEPGTQAEQAIEQLKELPGIGEWTAQYIGMRALRLPDAFPHSDLGICKALNATPAQALKLAEPWRPWRAYAALHLWLGSA